MLSKTTGRPAHTVLRVQLGGQGKAGERAVQAFLVAPGCVFALSSEANIEVTVTEDVVHGSESIVRAADLTIHDGMKPVTFAGGCRDFQEAISGDRRNELVRVAIRRCAQ